MRLALSLIDLVARAVGVPGAPGAGSFSVEHIVQSTRASRRLSDARHLKDTMADALRLALPSGAEELIEQINNSEFKAPSGWMLERGRCRFDVACMLCRRDTNRVVSMRRQLLFDASPQKGIEYLQRGNSFAREDSWCAPKTAYCH